MNTNLALKDGWDISQFSDEELDLIQQKITERKVNSLAQRVEQMEDRVSQAIEKIDIINTEVSNKIDDLKVENDKKLEVSINTYRVNTNKYDFESQADFGNKFRVSIGAGTVGKLFKIVGLAKPSKGKTEPYRTAISEKKATTEIVNGFETVRWNHEKCLKQVEQWLGEYGLLEKFYSIDKEKDLQKFINELYVEYCL